MKQLLCFLLLFILTHAGKYPDGPPTEKNPVIQDWDDPMPLTFIILFYIFLGYILIYSSFRYLIDEVGEHRQINPSHGKQEAEMVEVQSRTGIADVTDFNPEHGENYKRGPNVGKERKVSDEDLEDTKDGVGTFQKRQSALMLDGIGDGELTLFADDVLYVNAYKTSILGYIGLAATLGMSALFSAAWLCVLIDYYYGCQVESIDNQCYYGTYFISGWSNNINLYNSPPKNDIFQYNFFFLLWWMWLAWFGVLLFFKDTLMNWFRSRCNLANAEYLYIWIKNEQAILCKKTTWAVQLGRQIVEKYKRIFNIGEPGHSETVPVQTVHVNGKPVRFVEFEFVRYIFNGEELCRPEIVVSKEISEIAKLSDEIDLGVGGLTGDVAQSRLDLIGLNEIPYRPSTITELLYDEFCTLFYFYQWMIYMVWFYWSYLFTAASEYSIVIMSATYNMYLKWTNQNTIARITAADSVETVMRERKWTEIRSKLIVPGDIIKVKNDWVVPCDIVLVKGTAVCDEAGLTGESMPISKVSATRDSDAEIGEKNASRHTLFAGTRVLQAGASNNNDVLGLVIKTGINTSKGELIQTILHPAMLVFKYDEEYTIAFLILFCYGVFLFWFTILLNTAIGSNSHWVVKFLRGIFAISQMLSPLLPLTLVVGQAAASERLIKESQIFCVNPKRINICGKIRVCCFDKTGTLTKEGLDFLGAVALEDKIGKLRCGEIVAPDKLSDVVRHGLATCHAVTALKGGDGGKDTLVGNQVEVKMFASTGWKLLEETDSSPKVVSADGSQTLSISKRYEFDHHLMRMSVIVEDGANPGDYRVYTKGAYETIEELCDPNTVPDDFLQISERYAKEGCYVLGLCTKKIEDFKGEGCTRYDIETKNSFECLGLILFRNELKKDTTEAITQLKNGDTRTVMITGDNAACGYYVAKECGMIDQKCQFYLAVLFGDNVVWNRLDTEEPEKSGLSKISDEIIADKNCEIGMLGNAFEKLKEQGKMDRLLLKTRVYARFSPQQKQEAVGLLINKGLVVGMCGDGGNDCGALRAAHAGLALSDAEASVVSPFTAKSKSVMAMVDLLREGRCSLATSFASWKFIITFGQSYVFAKEASVYHDSVMASMCYLCIDVVVLIAISFGLTLARPLDNLSKERPTSSLLGYHTVSAIGGITLINFIFCVVTWVMVHGWEDYIVWPLKCGDGNSWWLFGDNWESMVAFSLFIWQMSFAGLLFGFGSRFRKPIWTNWVLCLMMLFYVITFSVVILGPENGLTAIFHFSQENHNRRFTPSTSWQNYQNVNDIGNPRFFKDDCAVITMSETEWNSFLDNGGTFNGTSYAENSTYSLENHDDHWRGLYSEIHNGEVITPVFDISKEAADDGTAAPTYVPGQSLLYDTCLWDFSQTTKQKPECPAGKKDGIFQDLSTEYSMPFELRLNLWIICVVNQLVSWVWITQGIDGFGRRMMLDKYKTEIEADRIQLDL